MSKGRVLVIDDDEWVCRLLSVAMKEAGYEVTVTGSAAEGFSRAADEQPDCVVCDVDLPDQSGYWVAGRIRQHPTKVSMAPFVFLTGRDDREHRLEGFSAGGDAYLTKPFRIDEVVAQVDALVQMAVRLKKSRLTMNSVPPSGPAMMGNLAQMNVATVLTMLDLERRSGKLELSTQGHTAELVISNGAIASARVGNGAVAPLAAVRLVTGWGKGKFSFTPLDSLEEGAGEPINALLMEAARLEDESSAEPSGRTSIPSDKLSGAWLESMNRSPRPPGVEPSSRAEPSDAAPAPEVGTKPSESEGPRTKSSPGMLPPPSPALQLEGLSELGQSGPKRPPSKRPVAPPQPGPRITRTGMPVAPPAPRPTAVRSTSSSATLPAVGGKLPPSPPRPPKIAATDPLGKPGTAPARKPGTATSGIVEAAAQTGDGDDGWGDPELDALAHDPASIRSDSIAKSAESTPGEPPQARQSGLVTPPKPPRVG